jgi:hypothetical protein
VPGVEVDLHDLLPEGECVLGGLEDLPAPHQLGDPVAHGLHEEGLARAPVAEEPDCQGWFEAPGGEQVGEGVDLGPDVDQVVADGRLVGLVVGYLDGLSAERVALEEERGVVDRGRCGDVLAVAVDNAGEADLAEQVEEGGGELVRAVEETAEQGPKLDHLVAAPELVSGDLGGLVCGGGELGRSVGGDLGAVAREILARHGVVGRENVGGRRADVGKELAGLAVAGVGEHDADQQVELVGLNAVDGPAGTVGPNARHRRRPPQRLLRRL